MKPMSFWRSIPYFALPSIFLALLFWKLMPLLDKLGKPLLYMYTGAMAFFSLVLLMLAIGFYQKEQHPRGSLRERFRLNRMNGGDWAWSLVLAGVLFLSHMLLASLSEYIRLNWMTPPKFFFRMLDSGPGYIMEVSLRGNWIAPVFFLLAAFLQAIGEECYFRGYIFPRQEKSMGALTWLPHALLWTVYLSAQPWDLPRALIVAVATTITVQRRRNTTVSIVARIFAAVFVLIGLYST